MLQGEERPRQFFQRYGGEGGREEAQHVGEEAGEEEGGVGEGDGKVGWERYADDAVLKGEEEASEGGQKDLRAPGGWRS